MVSSGVLFCEFVTLVFLTPPSRPGYDCNLLPCCRQLRFAKYSKNTHHSHDVTTKQLKNRLAINHPCDLKKSTQRTFLKNFKRMTASKGGGRALSILWVGHGSDSRGNRLRFPERVRDFPLFKALRPSLQPTEYSTHWVAVALPRGVKRQGHEDPSRSEVRNEWS
jgi:hypothetical protein